MISVQQHLERILSTVKVIRPFELGVLDAQGCVLAEDVTAQGSLPGFTNSAMDGYAVHAGDVALATPDSPVVLPVVNDIAAGNTSALSLARGQTMRIMTGAPMPQGADAVVPVEDTDAAVAKVTELGGSVMMQPMDIDAGRFAVVGDNAGAPFAVIKLAPRD